MATQSTNTEIDHTSDAGFRAWVDEFHTLLKTGGALVDGSDTGQLTISTASRPAVNTSAGFRIYRFDDALQSSVPVFLRVDYGTGSAAHRPRALVTIGNGTNGSGTVTGAIISDHSVLRDQAPTSTVTAYPSFACGHPGYIALQFKRGGSGNGYGLLKIERVPDHTGVPSGAGLSIELSNSAGTAIQQWSWRRVGTANVLGPHRLGCLAPGDPSSSSRPGGSPGAWRHFAALPDPVALLGSVTVLASEVSAGATFTGRPVGATDRTYLCCGPDVPPQPEAATSSWTKYAYCFRYD